MKTPALLVLLLCSCSIAPEVEWSRDSLAWQRARSGPQVAEGYSYVESNGQITWLGIAIPGEAGGYYRVREESASDDDRALVWSAFESGNLISMSWGERGTPLAFRSTRAAQPEAAAAARCARAAQSH